MNDYIEKYTGPIALGLIALMILAILSSIYGSPFCYLAAALGGALIAPTVLWYYHLFTDI